MSGAHRDFLEEMARDVVAAFLDGAGAVAALVAGSTADGTADEWSDIDLILFYDSWPGADALTQARATLDPADLRTLGGDPAGAVYLEQFMLNGVACQVVHQTVDAWRQT